MVSQAAPTLTNTTIFDQKVIGDALGLPLFQQGAGNSLEEPDRFCDCWAAVPAPVAASRVGGATPTGFGDETADYVGAFKDASPDSNWMKGLWVDWSSK